MRRTCLLTALLLAPVAAVAQPAPQPGGTAKPGTITAEGTETVRMAPNVARISVIARAEDDEPDTAADAATDKAKKFTDAVAKLQMKTVKATALPLKANKSAGQDNDLPGGVPRVPALDAVAKPTQAARGVVVTVTDGDFATLSAAVEKVQKLALKHELGGPPGVADDYRPWRQGGDGGIRVTYSRGDGEEELLAAALAKATKKATLRAEGIASGLGLKLGAVVSAEEAGNDLRYGSVRYYGSGGSDADDELVDGELVRTVRVRVVYAVK